MAEDQRAALEELRTADRIVAGVLSEMRSLQRDQLRDVFGGHTSEGHHGGAIPDEVHAAELQLNEAEYHLRLAAARVGVELGQRDHELAAPDDYEAVVRINQNVATAQRLQRQVRDLFKPDPSRFA